MKTLNKIELKKIVGGLTAVEIAIALALLQANIGLFGEDAKVENYEDGSFEIKGDGGKLEVYADGSYELKIGDLKIESQL